MDDFPILKMKDTLKEIERRLSEKIEADNPRFADEIQEDELKVKQLKMMKTSNPRRPKSIVN